MADKTIVAPAETAPAAEAITPTPSAPSNLDLIAEHLPELAELQAEEAEKAKAAEAAAAVATPAKKDEELEKKDAPAETLTPDKFQERVDKLTREKKDAQEAAEALRLENERLKAGGEKKPETAPTVVTGGILAGVQTPDEVQTKVNIAHHVKGLAKRHFRDGETIYVEDKDAEGGKRELTTEELRVLEDEAEETLRAAPERIAFLQNRAAREAQTSELLPEYFEGEGANKFAAVQQAFPELARFEDSSAATIALIIGFEEIARRRADKGEKPAEAAPDKPATPPAKAKAEVKLPGGKVPLAPPAPGATTPPRVDAKDAKLAEAEKAFEESDGDEEALARYLEAKAAAA